MRSVERGGLARLIGFGFITVAFAVSNPFLLIGVPLTLLLVSYGPRNIQSGLVVAATLTVVLLGERTGLWWFERGWPLLLGGAFLWIAGWRPAWGFTSQALAALGAAFLVASVVFAASPGVWRDLDALMTTRAGQAAEAALALLGDRLEGGAQELVHKMAGFQVSVFPALLGVSSMSALGLAVSLRTRLSAEGGRGFGSLRNFRFNDHLVWIWLVGLVLIVAPLGELAERVGSNAVFFMGALFVLRGTAVLLTLLGGLPLLTGLLGGLLAVLVYPLLALLVAVTFLVGLSDTWLNVRGRLASGGSVDKPPGGV